MSMEMNERSSWGSGGSDLRRELRVLWAHRWLVVSTAAILIGLAAAYTFLRTPIYTGTTTVFIKPTGISSSDLAGADIGKLVSPETEVAIATSEDVALIAKATLGSDATTQTLLKHVSVNVPLGSQIMEVNYSDPMKQKAADGANAFADAYISYRADRADQDVTRQQAAIEERLKDVRIEISDANAIIAENPDTAESRDAVATRESLEAQVALLTAKQLEIYGINTDPGDVVSEAIPPTSPSSPNHELDLALGLFARPVRGCRPGVPEAPNGQPSPRAPAARGGPGRAGALDDPEGRGLAEPRRGEAHHGHRSALSCGGGVSRPATGPDWPRPRSAASKVVMVLSPMAGEGKSTTAANLAVVLAQSGRSVALITADLRRPRSHEFFEVASEPGLSEFLGGTATLAEVERRVSAQVGGDLVIYPAGRLRAHPAELLQSRQMQRFLEDQRETFDFLILDCPPVLAVSDALPLIPLSDGVLFVADAESTTREQVSLARDRLLQMGANLLGAVINGLTGSSSGYYDDRYAYTYQPTNTTNGNGSGSKRSRRVAKRSGTEG